MDFPDALEEDVFKPLGLNRTSTEKPEDALGIIPPKGSLWSYDLGEEGP